jgi:hypothetical protein
MNMKRVPRFFSKHSNTWQHRVAVVTYFTPDKISTYRNIQLLSDAPRLVCFSLLQFMYRESSLVRRSCTLRQVCSLSPSIYAQGECFLMRRNCNCNCTLRQEHPLGTVSWSIIHLTEHQTIKITNKKHHLLAQHYPQPKQVNRHDRSAAESTDMKYSDSDCRLMYWAEPFS